MATYLGPRKSLQYYLESAFNPAVAKRRHAKHVRAVFERPGSFSGVTVNSKAELRAAEVAMRKAPRAAAAPDPVLVKVPRKKTSRYELRPALDGSAKVSLYDTKQRVVLGVYGDTAKAEAALNTLARGFKVPATPDGRVKLWWSRLPEAERKALDARGQTMISAFKRHRKTV